MSTGTPLRETILADILSSVAGISTANGYRTNVKYTSRSFRWWSQIDQRSEMPAVLVLPGDQNSSPNTTLEYTGKVEVRVVGYINYDNTQASEIATKRLINLWGDIVEVVMGDYQRNNTAVTTRLISDFMTEAAIDGEASVELVFEVEYDFLPTDVTQTL